MLLHGRENNFVDQKVYLFSQDRHTHTHSTMQRDELKMRQFNAMPRIYFSKTSL